MKGTQAGSGHTKTEVLLYWAFFFEFDLLPVTLPVAQQMAPLRPLSQYFLGTFALILCGVC